MLKELHIRDKHYDWSTYYTTPAALEWTMECNIDQKASAIVGWKLRIGNDYMNSGNNLASLIDVIHDYTFDEWRKLVVFTDDLTILTHFISGEVEVDTFNCAGKGIATCTIDKFFELRDIKFIDKDWEMLEGEHKIDKLFTFATFYMEDCKLFRGNSDKVGRLPVTQAQMIKHAYKQSLTKQDYEDIRALWPKDEKLYKIVMGCAFAGGYCDARTLTDTVGEMAKCDYKLSYLSRLLLDYMPMSPFVNGDLDKIDTYLATKCCLLCVDFYDISFEGIKFINVHRAVRISKEHELDKSGKIIRAKQVSLMLTELDFELVCRLADYDHYSIGRVLVADRGQLPDKHRRVIERAIIRRESYPKKTHHREFYKKLGESCWGVFVENSYRHAEGKTYDEFLKENHFASPYWGVWCTAHARYALLSMAILLGDDHKYSDTDCLLYTNPREHVQLIAKHNEAQQARMYKYCHENCLSYAYDKFKMVGSLCYEDGATEENFTIYRFTSMGPKQYLYSYIDPTTFKKVHIAKVAGPAKQWVVPGYEEKQNAWIKAFYNDEEKLYANFRSDYPIYDLEKKVDLIDRDCMLKYNGRVYHSKKYAMVYYIKKIKSVDDNMLDICEAFAELEDRQLDMGMVKRKWEVQIF